MLVLLRALPHGKDMAGAIELMKSVRVYRLGQDPVAPEWVDLTQKADEDFTPVPWEDNLTYWEVLAELINRSRRSPSSGRTTVTWPSWASPGAARSTR